MKKLYMNSSWCLQTRLQAMSQTRWKLQYSSQILKHWCDFPLPQCWFGYYSRLTASKYAWLNIAEGEGQM